MSRGFASIGLDRCKDAQNFGGVLRAAGCYDASLIVVGGARFQRSWTDTQKYHRHCPVLETSGDLMAMRPHGSTPVCIELCEGAMPLHKFTHPESAFYIFGPEDGSVSDEIVQQCRVKVMVPTKFCMNLAATVNVVLYDRMAKRGAA